MCNTFRQAQAKDETRWVRAGRPADVIVPPEPDPGTERAPPPFQRRTVTFGLDVSWSPRPLVNARSESVGEKPTFRTAFARRRCVVPAVAEWWEYCRSARRTASFRAERPLSFAGLLLRDSHTEHLIVLTREASGEAARYHHRAPVTLTGEGVTSQYLNGTPAEAVDAIRLAGTPELSIGWANHSALSTAPS